MAITTSNRRVAGTPSPSGGDDPAAGRPELEAPHRAHAADFRPRHRTSERREGQAEAHECDLEWQGLRRTVRAWGRRHQDWASAALSHREPGQSILVVRSSRTARGPRSGDDNEGESAAMPTQHTASESNRARAPRAQSISSRAGARAAPDARHARGSSRLCGEPQAPPPTPVWHRAGPEQRDCGKRTAARLAPRGSTQGRGWQRPSFPRRARPEEQATPRSREESNQVTGSPRTAARTTTGGATQRHGQRGRARRKVKTTSTWSRTSSVISKAERTASRKTRPPSTPLSASQGWAPEAHSPRLQAERES